ncbi:hypothetical protein HPP92_011180 [Vanilla planifolia]|uniref:BZIP domain-containing protein n=1 Tax=Vanilla planifolia TaxID=51239 RepID=A0A835R085_VANPL|nr:hypothetical protein HPP92_011180 [Vanilla planifolia]
MGTNESMTPSKVTKSPVQEQPTAYAYPDWGSLQAYYGTGFPLPLPYFNANLVHGHTHPYMWSQSMIAPFAGPYATIYQHGGFYSHPAMSYASPGNQEASAKSSTITDGTAKKSILFEEHVASVGNGKSEIEVFNGNELSQSGENVEDDSSDGSTESGGSYQKGNRSSEDIPNSGKKDADTHSFVIQCQETTPTTSIQVSAPSASIARETLAASPGLNAMPGMDLKASSLSIIKPILPYSSAMDERQLKRERRKQSNRESARRSRLRKQAETEELAVKVGTLTAENTSLRSEITRLTQSSEKLRSENSTLMEKLKMAKVKQAEHMNSQTAADNDEAPPIILENLLSRIDESSRISQCNQLEDETRDNSNGQLT